MKTYIVMILLTLTIATGPVVNAQSNAVPWSALDAGSSVAYTGSTRVISVVGQSFTGAAFAVNDAIKSGFLVYPFRSSLSSGIQSNGGSEAPTTYELSQNYPNPFNPTTGVRFQVPGISDVKLVVYDILGREVATLVNERKAAGRYEARFDASGLASGVYIYRMTAGSFVQTRKMILLK